MTPAEVIDMFARAWNTGSAEWQQLPRELLDPVPGLLEEAGAFGQPAPRLAEDTAEGDYLEVWELTGALHDRPFRLAVQRAVPGQWPSLTLGRRLSDSLYLTLFAGRHMHEHRSGADVVP